MESLDGKPTCNSSNRDRNHFCKIISSRRNLNDFIQVLAFRVYTLKNLTPIRLFCVKGRFSGLLGIKTDHVWPEIWPLGFKGLKAKQVTSIHLVKPNMKVQT